MEFSRITFLLGVLVFLHAASILIPQVILGAAIDWPNSLDFTPRKALPLVADNLSEIRSGYGIYLFYSIAWIMVGPLLAWYAMGKNKIAGPLFITAVALICVSALARAIGIIRWLTASTFLAQNYESATPEMAQTIELIRDVVNAWGGAIGELLGVSLFSVGWLICVSILILRNDSLPNWLGYFGLIVCPIFASPIIELFGYTANIFVSTLSVHLWLFATGSVMMYLGLTNKVQ